ncbi:MAG: twin-arginine translocation signal domain-containing protein [Candidatus Electrothrix sp. ATG2]|nr:twin-arginine translocation signal domain-containing protein [Candidatus Electrothrix sp. ATG2]
MIESRRDFLKTGCLAIAGATAASSIGLTTPKESQASSAELPFGWPSEGLNIEETKELAYTGYLGTSRFSGAAGPHCASATFGAIVGQLQEVALIDPAFAPYNNIPLGMMKWGAGGIVGFASLCGALNGACAAIGLACGAHAKQYMANLLTWYSEAELPIYPGPDSDISHITSTAGSNLCHVSVTNWCLESGYGSGSPERGQRCACLAADVAGKVVEMVNSGYPEELGNPRDNNTTCGSCHSAGKDFDGGQFTRGKMDCNSCHVDIRKSSPEGHRFRGNKDK